MDSIKLALVSVLLPAAVCGVLLVFGRSRRAQSARGARSPGISTWVGAIALAAGFIASHVAALGVPRFGAWEHRAAYAAIAVGFAGAVLGVLRSAPARWSLLVVAGFAVAWLVAWPAMPAEYSATQRWVILVCSGAVAGGVMHFTSELSQRAVGWTWTLSMLPAFAATALLCLRAGYAKFVQLAICAAAATVAGLVVSVWMRQPLGRGFGAVVAGLLWVILLGGYFHGFQVPPDDPTACFAMVGLTPLALWIGQARRVQSRPVWVIASIRLVCTLALLSIAALLAVRLAGV